MAMLLLLLLLQPIFKSEGDQAKNGTNKKETKMNVGSHSNKVVASCEVGRPTEINLVPHVD